MELNRVAHLLELIAEKTKAKEIKWEAGIGSNDFSTTVDNFKLGLSRDTPDADYDVDPDYYFSIRRITPKSPDLTTWVDSFSDEELKGALPNSFKLMRDLYQEIRRQINGVEEIVEDLIKSLDGKN